MLPLIVTTIASWDELYFRILELFILFMGICMRYWEGAYIDLKGFVRKS